MADLTLSALLASWSFRPDVLLILMTLGGVYASGWRRLRKVGRRRGAPVWRLILYLAGLAALVLALLSPIDRLSSMLFSAHMVQHLLLVMVAAPLVLLGNPLAASLWGLPRRVRRAAGRFLTRSAAFRKVLGALTLMPVAWLLSVGTLWIWHLPAAYEAALREHAVHDLEHVTFFGTALLFWWPIIEPAPRLHRRLPLGFGILYLLAATAQNIALGALIAVSERVLYPFYAATPRLFGLSPLDDQGLAGGIMWTSAHMYLIPLLLLVTKIVDREERVTRQREAA